MHFFLRNPILLNVILLHSNHLHVSPIRVATFRVIMIPHMWFLCTVHHSRDISTTYNKFFTSNKLSSSSIGTTAHCGLWPVEQCPSIFSYLPPTLSIFSLPALEDVFLLPLSILSWVFPFFSSLPFLEWSSFWASYPPPFSLGDLTSLSFVLLSLLHWHYSPLWALACRKMSFHFFLSATNSVHLLTPITWRSFSTSSFL